MSIEKCGFNRTRMVEGLKLIEDELLGLALDYF
jgi:hypothetical protein